MKKALVIGGTSGIGLGLSKELLANNFKVTVAGIEEDLIAQLNDLNNINLLAIHLDCMQEKLSQEIENLVKKMQGLDLLVFSAGVGNLNKDLGYKVENKANELNVLAFTEVIDWGFRFFEKQGYGHLVGITSFSGIFGCRVAPAYHAAKAYQITYLEALRQKAKKSGKEIYVTDVRPGFVETPMTAGKKMFWTATKEEAAKQIFKLIKRKKGRGYVTKRWQIMAVLMKAMPRFVRDRI